MRPVRLPVPAALTLVAALAAPAAAQRESYSYVSYAGPEVSLLSGASEEEIARINTPVLAGDRMVTGASSRAEVVLASGNVVRIDAKTDLRFDLMSSTYESDDDRDLLYLARGDVVAEIRAPQPGERAFRIDTDDATVVMEGRGLVRVDAGRRGTEVYVLAGEAMLAGREGSLTLREGEYASVSGTEEIGGGDADPPRDRFARFVEERRSLPPAGGASSWVSSDYDYEASLAAFDENGSWVYVSSEDRWGWRPTVALDWRPYSLGYWRWAPCGLTWVSYEPWGWLPYHYGRWLREAAFGWVWLPGTAYSPAWVWWSYTPTWVGWCPLGGAGVRGYGSPAYPGMQAGLSQLPRIRGRVDPSRIDQDGWNYAPANRIGKRLDPSREIVRGERLPIRPGDTAFLSTSPLRIDRGSGTAPAAVREVIRRVAERGTSPGAPPVDERITSILRRGPSPRPAGEADWRHPAPGRDARDATSSAGTARRRQPALDGGWRSPASKAPSEVKPRPTERTAPTDTGWRVPPRESPSTDRRTQAAPGRAERSAPEPGTVHEAPAAPRAAPAAPRAAPPAARHAAPAAPRKSR